jgi:Arc/MetJ-type ribon-helix-helix transcriptional regulator
MSQDFHFDFRGLWDSIRSQLQEKGVSIDFENGFDFSCVDPLGGAGVKVVCVAPDLKQSVEEMGRKPRDQVVMVRVDESTLGDLDAWVATGAVKSRSEAAALFIREGLKVRADELERLRDALREVKEAQERLRQQAREIFGAGAAATGEATEPPPEEARSSP